MRRVCIKCRQLKPLSDFHRRPDRPGHFFTKCKKCHYAVTRAHKAHWYPANRSRVRETYREWCERQSKEWKEARRRKGRQYYARNRAKIIAYCKKRAKAAAAALSDDYVAFQIKRSHAVPWGGSVPPELIKAKRAVIALKRCLKTADQPNSKETKHADR